MNYFTDEHAEYWLKPYVKIVAAKYHAAKALLTRFVNASTDNGETSVEDVMEAIKLLEEGESNGQN